MLDIEKARALFPALKSDIYFENAGGSLVAQPVIDALNGFLTDSPVQPAYWSSMSKASKARVDAGYNAAATLMSCDPDEVVVSHSTTVNLNSLARSLSANWTTGDRVIISEQDHEANRGCWLRLKTQGIEVSEWKIDPQTGELSLDGLIPLLDDSVRLVAFTQTSNVVGSINPVREVVDLLHARDIQVCVDGVAFTPHRQVDVKAFGADYYVFSSYKTFGMHAGVMYVAKERQELLGNQNHHFLTGLARVNPGGKQSDLVSSMVGITKYLNELGVESFDAFAEHEEKLSAAVLDFLDRRNDIRLIGSSSPDKKTRVPTIAFQPTSIAPRALAAALAERGIAVAAGNFYAPACLNALGIDPDVGAVRVSLVHYNTLDEVERLTIALAELLG